MSRSERIPAFLNARGTFTRLEDGALFRGWVIGEREPQFLVTFEDPREVGAGEVFLCEIAVRGLTVKLQAVATQASCRNDVNHNKASVTVAMNQLRVVSIQRSDGRERFLMRNLTASVWTGAERIAADCEVVDVSDSGLSLILPKHVSEGDALHVMVACSGETLQFECEVRYALKLETGARIGLLIHHNDRIVQSKWSRFITELGGVLPQFAS